MANKIIWLFIFIIGALVGCSSLDSNNNSANHDDQDLEIFTSLYPIQYVVDKVGGDTVTTHTIYPPGTDAHTYEPTSKDIVEIADGDAFFYLGDGMESFSDTIADSLSNQNISLIELGENKDLFIESDHEHHHQAKHEDESHHNHGDMDPHIWLDPQRLIDISKIIKEQLIELNPQSEQTYEKNFASLKEELTQLDEDYTSVLESKKNKHILVSHAAYGYWEERYGVEQIPIHGLSSSDEPSQKELTEIVRITKKYDLNYVFFEQNTPDQVSKIIQDEIDAQTAVIHNLEVLTEEDIENNEDYISLMRCNLKVLDQAME